jgi:hypothetical protein
VSTWVCLAAIALAGGSPVATRAQPLPDFSGTWRIDDLRSGRPTDVWGQTRARVVMIDQTPTDLTLTTDGGGINVPVDLQRYRLDGQETTVRDDSLGELANFVRKVRTLAQWDGEALKTETETVSESVDPNTGAVKIGRGITSVLTFRLEAGGTELVVERTGFRAQAPVTLHGRPYARQDDLAYNVDRVRYVKTAVTGQ